MLISYSDLNFDYTLDSLRGGGALKVIGGWILPPEVLTQLILDMAWCAARIAISDIEAQLSNL